MISNNLRFFSNLGFILPLTLIGNLVFCQSKLLTPTSITSSTSGTDLVSASSLIDDSGLTSVPTINDYTSVKHSTFGSWVTTDCSFPCDYFNSNLPSPSLILELGSTQTITDVIIWNYELLAGNGNLNDNASKHFDVEVSTNGSAGPWITIGRGFTIPEQSTFAHTISLNGAYTANAVRITITDNYFELPGDNGGDRVGLSEIKFICNPQSAAGAIPTMGEWGLISLSLLMLIIGIHQLKYDRSTQLNLID